MFRQSEWGKICLPHASDNLTFLFRGHTDASFPEYLYTLLRQTAISWPHSISVMMEHQAVASLTRAFRPLSRRLTHNCGATQSLSASLRLQASSRAFHRASSPMSPPHAQSSKITQVSACTKTASRHFSTSSPRLAKAVINPRKDDDGNDMVIEIMPRASHVRLQLPPSTKNY